MLVQKHAPFFDYPLGKPFHINFAIIG